MDEYIFTFLMGKEHPDLSKLKTLEEKLNLPEFIDAKLRDNENEISLMVNCRDGSDEPLIEIKVSADDKKDFLRLIKYNQEHNRSLFVNKLRTWETHDGNTGVEMTLQAQVQ